jgi:magnesium transporter
MMTLDYVAVHPEWTVREALDYIREHGYDRETLNMVFVVDDRATWSTTSACGGSCSRRWTGRCSALLDGNYTMLSPTDDREKALGLFKKFDRVALPVVDENNKLIGIVTVDDMLDVAEEEATEDIQKMGGTEALDEPYTTIALTQDGEEARELARDPVPRRDADGDRAEILRGRAGQGHRALAVPAAGRQLGRQRRLAGGDAGHPRAGPGRVPAARLVAHHAPRAGGGPFARLILGVIGFLRITVWSFIFPNTYGEHWMLVAATVSTALVGIVLWGSLMGSMLPLIIKRAGFDPATSSAPFIATLVDVTGLIIYFSVALLIMRGTLLTGRWSGGCSAWPGATGCTACRCWASSSCCSRWASAA